MPGDELSWKGAMAQQQVECRSGPAPGPARSHARARAELAITLLCMDNITSLYTLSTIRIAALHTNTTHYSTHNQLLAAPTWRQLLQCCVSADQLPHPSTVHFAHD